MSTTESGSGESGKGWATDRGVVGPREPAAGFFGGSSNVATTALPDETVMASLVIEQPPSSPFRTTAATAAAREPTEVRWREALTVVLTVALCDATIFRGHGHAGLAVLFVLLPALLLFGVGTWKWGPGTRWIGVLLLLFAGKSLWCGSALVAAAGFFLVCAFALGLTGQSPQVVETIAFGLQTFSAGLRGLLHHARSIATRTSSRRQPPWINVALPVGVGRLFGLIFVFANPNLTEMFSAGVDEFFARLRQWLAHFSILEICFWIAVAWTTVGLLQPVMRGPVFEESLAVSEKSPPAVAPLYPAFRNTLLTVVVLFALYLGFEFKTLWFRVFPSGFHYSGYAHEGAAWLTCALALATLLLSLIFRGVVLRDARLIGLRRLAWIWSAENFLLAAAVYNRLFIYIGFNGMTRMRTIGLFGISCVVVGFMLVLWKIARNRDFVWLLRRQLWTLALAVCLYSLTPVDTFVMQYNVRRILADDLAPSVQISVQPISSEGVLLLQPLVDSPHETIREGVRALLASRLDDAEKLAIIREQQGWTTFQISDQFVLRELRANRQRWSDYQTNDDHRAATLRRFHDYVYQWF